jgi:hypothetical protein
MTNSQFRGWSLRRPKLSQRVNGAIQTIGGTDFHERLEYISSSKNDVQPAMICVGI